ncbi:MAG: hypothetical protein QOH79_3843 [Acidimicrobiaceae bacterium]
MGGGSAGAQAPRCVTGQLKVTFRNVEGGLGHFGVAIVFTNAGDSCVIVGYPGVDGVSADGSHVVEAQRTPAGYLGGARGDPPLVTLAKGEVASALFEGFNGAVDSKGPCPPYNSLAVIAPDDTEEVAVPVPWEQPLCYPEIHPVVVGDTGGANVPG